MKNLLKSMLNRSGLLVLTRRLFDSLVILRYHSVKDDPGAHDDFISSGIIHSTDIFTAQMEMVARQYQPLSLDEVPGILAGRKTFPKNAVVVTFDDGYADNEEIVAPILSRVGIPGTFFLTVDHIGQGIGPWYVRLRYGFWKTPLSEWLSPHNNKVYRFADTEERVTAFLEHCYLCTILSGAVQLEFVEKTMASLEIDEQGVYDRLMLTWPQAKSLISMGHTVGSHSLSHPNLSYIGQGELSNEINVSKKIIEEKIGIQVEHFSYPNPALTPNFDDRVIQTIITAGYLTAVSSFSGCVNRGNNPFCLSRMTVPADLVSFKWNLDSIFVGRKL